MSKYCGQRCGDLIQTNLGSNPSSVTDLTNNVQKEDIVFVIVINYSPTDIFQSFLLRPQEGHVFKTCLCHLLPEASASSIALAYMS